MIKEQLAELTAEDIKQLKKTKKRQQENKEEAIENNWPSQTYWTKELARTKLILQAYKIIKKDQDD